MEKLLWRRSDPLMPCILLFWQSLSTFEILYFQTCILSDQQSSNCPFLYQLTRWRENLSQKGQFIHKIYNVKWESRLKSVVLHLLTLLSSAEDRKFPNMAGLTNWKRALLDSMDITTTNHSPLKQKRALKVSLTRKMVIHNTLPLCSKFHLAAYFAKFLSYLNICLTVCCGFHSTFFEGRNVTATFHFDQAHLLFWHILGTVWTAVFSLLWVWNSGRDSGR